MSRGRFVGAALAIAMSFGVVAALWWWQAGAPPPVAAPLALERIDGGVTLAPGSGPVPQGSTVVVYAYAIDGRQAPLAVLRMPATSLPLDFRLDDSLAQNAEHRLSSVRQVVIGARLGTGGDALSQVGDWLARSQNVAPGAQGVQLVLHPPPK
jgi:hypothetical protein